MPDGPLPSNPGLQVAQLFPQRFDFVAVVVIRRLELQAKVVVVGLERLHGFDERGDELVVVDHHGGARAALHGFGHCFDDILRDDTVGGGAVLLPDVAHGVDACEQLERILEGVFKRASDVWR